MESHATAYRYLQVQSTLQAADLHAARRQRFARTSTAVLPLPRIALRWAGPHRKPRLVLELIVQKASYLGFIAFLALCGLGLPVPEEAPLVLAGVLSANGTLEHPTWAFGACLLGALLGDSLMYFIGRRLGHGYLMKHPSFARFIDPEREEKFERIVSQHGFKLVFLTRFLIGVRGPVYFAAGAARVPYLRFLLWDLVAATVVVSIVFGLGYRYGEQIAGWVTKAEYALTGIAILALAAVAGVLIYRRYKSRVTDAIDRLSETSEGEGDGADADADDEVRLSHTRIPPTPTASNGAAAKGASSKNGAASANGHAADQSANKQRA